VSEAVELVSWDESNCDAATLSKLQYIGDLLLVTSLADEDYLKPSLRCQKRGENRLAALEVFHAQNVLPRSTSRSATQPRRASAPDAPLSRSTGVITV
jgi:hypothetical protein